MMQAIRSITRAGYVSLVLLSVSCTASHAAHSESARESNDLSHVVPFERGGTWLRDGDKITIGEIHGTADEIAVGNLYEIKGTYALASHPKARLTVDITSNDPRHFSPMNTQTKMVDQGDGHFTVYMYMWCEGNPHLSFYPMERGESFASVYFGTGASTLKHAGWLDDPKE